MLNYLESLPTTLKEYPKVLRSCEGLQEQDRVTLLRTLCRVDLYFLLRYALNRKDVQKEWIFDRCREIQAEPNGHLDLWAREHYKSTIITFAKTIQDILASHGDDPLPGWSGREVTVGIFSHTRPIAKGFLRQIMQELKENKDLIYLFPDILWKEPDRNAPKWSEDDGIVLKRKSRPKESTVEAWGIVDGQPTSKHFMIRVYDDVVTEKSVGSVEMMTKTQKQWELSLNLGTRGGFERYIGTRYHYNDVYKEIMKRKTAKSRIYPATGNGKVDGVPVLMTTAELAKKRNDQGPYTFGCQMLQDPKADSVQGFKLEWLRHYKGTKTGEGMNIYIIVDPANEKKKKSDYTSKWVLGAGSDGNDYLLGGVRDRLSLTERIDKLFELHRHFKTLNPGQKIPVGYEKYGKDSDIDYILEKQNRENYHFDVVPLGGSMAKNDRIRRLIPDFENSKIWLPETLNYVNHEGQSVDLVKAFIDEEYLPFPVGEHDDMLDNLARKKDMNIEYPLPGPVEPIYVPKLKRAWL